MIGTFSEARSAVRNLRDLNEFCCQATLKHVKNTTALFQTSPGFICFTAQISLPLFAPMVFSSYVRDRNDKRKRYCFVISNGAHSDWNFQSSPKCSEKSERLEVQMLTVLRQTINFKN